MKEIKLAVTGIPKISHAHTYATEKYDLNFKKGLHSLEISYIEEGNALRTSAEGSTAIGEHYMFASDFSREFHMQSDRRHVHSTVGLSMPPASELSPAFTLVLPEVWLPSETEVKLLYRIIERRTQNPDDPGASLLSLQLIFEISERHRERTLRESADGNALYAEKARKYIAAHLYEKIRVGDIAKALRVSEGHLSRAFRSAANESIIDYVNARKVNTMADMIREKGVTLAAAAEAVGISDPGYASRLFARTKGISAAKYLKGFREEDATEKEESDG